MRVPRTHTGADRWLGLGLGWGWEFCDWNLIGEFWGFDLNLGFVIGTCGWGSPQPQQRPSPPSLKAPALAPAPASAPAPIALNLAGWARLGWTGLGWAGWEGGGGGGRSFATGTWFSEVGFCDYKLI